MAINSFPSQAGGGQANLNFIGSVHMETYNRSWAQGGSAGYYALYSTNQENGYAYFVGTGTSTGAPLNRLVSVTHAFTRIDIIAPTNDMISLYKAEVKSTTVFNNPFDADGTIGKLAIPSFPSIILSSGNFVLPNNALPLTNILVVGGGGHGGDSHAGGGGGGGSVVKLTAYQAVGTTACNIGGAGNSGGRSSFGNVYALGGGRGGNYNNDGNQGHSASDTGNGGGAGGYHTRSGGAGTTQTSGTGLGTAGSPAFHGGFSGGNSIGTSNSWRTPAGGGGGAGGVGGNGVDNGAENNAAPGAQGPGHTSDITGTNYVYGAGGAGGRYNNGNGGLGPWSHNSNYGNGGHGAHGNGGSQGGTQGVIVVRYYIP